MMATDKATVLAKIASINAVDGFDPEQLAVDFTDLNSGETRKRLPVMAQIAWFRLKYPEGRFMLSVKAEGNFFVATARVYANCTNPVDQYLSEATASRGYLPDKPTVSPREWAQTAALGIALRNAGFGLQFHAAGESFDEPAVDELGQATPQSAGTAGGNTSAPTVSSAPPVATATAGVPSAAQPEEDPLEKAMKAPCPISKYKGKTLGDLITSDPKALVWIATKYPGDPEISAAAKLICDRSLAATA